MDDKVLDSRQNGSGSTIRRRRECLSCGHRFTSYERIIDTPLRVIKRDGRIEDFNLDKIERGVRIATDKLKVTPETIEHILQNIEDAVVLQAGSKREITSKAIGEETLRQLYKVDKVAYVRFASVYRAFEDVDQFIEEIEKLSHMMDSPVKENGRA